MIEKFIILVSTLVSTGYPANFNAEQKEISSVIIKEAARLGEDPYVLMSIAFQESGIRKGQRSHTGDVGIFQINWRFWGKRIWRYESYKQFEKDMNDPVHATVAAVVVLKEMRLYKTCVGVNLFACYNGGPAWMKSKNIDKIVSYARRVEQRRKRYKRKYPSWSERRVK
tara:strand:+ start:1866 stop:2372 length:507 start_codon:yes stop_codon:yes gene_type:complete